MPLPRRSLLRAAAAVAGVGGVGGGALGAAMYEGWVPGRPVLQQLMGLNGPDGAVPDVDPGPVLQGSFVSRAREGRETGWSLLLPPDVDPSGLPLVVALHARFREQSDLLGPDYGLPQFLAAAVGDGVAPFAIATVDGGESCWHRRPSGDDPVAMVTDELLPLVAARGPSTDRLGVLGWSMGGYGALHLAGVLGAPRVRAVVAASPAMWADPRDATPSGFGSVAEYEEYTVQGRQSDLDGVAVRLDCGTGDPFYAADRAYADAFPTDADLTATFEPGAHGAGYWRRVLPAQLAFLGDHLAPTG